MKVNVLFVIFFVSIFFKIKSQRVKKNLIFLFVHGWELWTYM